MSVQCCARRLRHDRRRPDPASTVIFDWAVGRKLCSGRQAIRVVVSRGLISVLQNLATRSLELANISASRCAA